MYKYILKSLYLLSKYEYAKTKTTWHDFIFTGSKRFVCSKGKPTIRKRKNKLKFFKKAKLNSRRKPLRKTSNPILQSHFGAICKNQGKSKSCIIRIYTIYINI